MRKSFAATFLIVCSLVPRFSFAQQYATGPIETVLLSDGSLIRFERYAGTLRRLSEGREVARAKLPKAHPVERRTDVVLSKDETRLLLVHGASTHKYPPRHRVAVLDATSLRTIVQWPLGDCSFVDLRPRPSHVTLLCQQSQDPMDRQKKKTLALVTLDLNQAQMTRWFDLGGERRGIWFGPMFFGYYDLTVPLTVKTDACGVNQTSDPKLSVTVDASGDPAHILVLIRKAGPMPKDGPTTGEVWFVDSPVSGAPRRVAVVGQRPTTATLCEKALRVTHADAP